MDTQPRFIITESSSMPAHAGAYWVGGINNGLSIQLRKRPSWVHRFFMRWGFGWVWVDR